VPVDAGAPEWSRLLRNARERLGLSRAAVARRTRIATSTVRSYEIGTRHPSRDHLIATLDALQLEPVARTEILSAAGYSPEKAPLSVETTGYPFTIEEARIYAEEQPWPVTVMNENMDVVCANTTAQRLWDIDLDRDFPEAKDRSMLVVASDPRFADRIKNWDEAVGVGIAILKGHHRAPETMPEGSQAYFASVLSRFFEGDPRYIARFLALWESTPPRTPKVRWSFPIVWDAPGIGEIGFRVVVSNCNEQLALSFNDWIPVDVPSWRAWADLNATWADQ
jgi:transcriptional regulator with XRE-family HTH domain